MLAVLLRAMRELTLAKAIYREHASRFGTMPWIDQEPIRELELSNMPAWLREGEVL